MKLLSILLMPILLLLAHCENATDSESEPLELEFEVTHATAEDGSNGAIDLTVSGGELPYQFSWSNGEVTEDIENLVVGVYTVQVQSNDGQSLMDSAEVELLPDSGTVTDFEGYSYETVKIGDQWWMAENLRTTHTADGSTLGGVFVYNNNSGNVGDYGRLYTWEAALSACPTGWHLPSDEEWNVLENHLDSDAGTKLKVGGSTGFNAKMAGYRDAAGGYDLLGVWTMFWSSTYYTNDHAYVRNLFADQTGIVRSGVDVNAAISVRCIKDD
ncbi:FISUMP domain-containing protein [Candidatus Neomarinimicrobiota bacterium]